MKSHNTTENALGGMTKEQFKQFQAASKAERKYLLKLWKINPCQTTKKGKQ